MSKNFAIKLLAQRWLCIGTLVLALLINFGAASLERKHKYRTYRPGIPQTLNPVNLVNDVSKTKT